MPTNPERDSLELILNDSSRPLFDRVMAGDALRYSLVKDGECADYVAQRVIELSKPLLDDRRVYDAAERAYITRAPNNFHDYLIALEWNRPAKSRFYQPRMAVMREFADSFTEMMVNDVYDLILFSMPPRVGKTTISLFGLSWLIGRNPDSPILASAFAEKITTMLYGGLLEISEDPVYNYHEIFPRVRLVNTSAKDLTLDFRDDGKESSRKYKSVTCRAIEASLHGSTEARQLLYCDDLVSGIEEALSPTRLTMLCDKMTTNLYSRRKEGCKELHVGTRWSIHDPIGLVERQNEDNPRCKIIRIPALDPETGESNFDYPYGVGFSTAYYNELKRLEDDVTWQCVYQQEPIERTGLLFPADSLKYTLTPFTAEYLKDNPPDDIFAFCDVAFGGGDFLSMPIAYQWGDDPPVIADVVFTKGGYKESEPLVSGRLVSRNVARAVFEANNGGDFYSRDVTELVVATGHKCQVVATRAASNKSKETRIVQHSPAILDFVFLDPSAKDADGNYIASPMYRAFLMGLTSYTMSGKNPNDDAPDSLAGLAAMQRTNLNATLTVFNREHI